MLFRSNTGRALMDRHVCTVLGRLSGDGVVDPESLRVLEPHEHDVIRVSVGDGIWKVMSVWDVASGEAVATLEGHTEEWMTSVAWSPDGTRLASASSDCTVREGDVAASDKEAAVTLGVPPGPRQLEGRHHGRAAPQHQVGDPLSLS